MQKNSETFLYYILLLLLLLDITVFFDISVVRQIIGFICLTFFIGFIILKLLEFDKLNKLEIVLFSVGLSIAFIMLSTSFLNEFGSMLNFSKPLSLASLMIIINILLLTGGILVYTRDVSLTVQSDRKPGKSLLTRALKALLLCLPFLSICGAIYVTVYGANAILLFLIILISVLFAVSVLFEKLFPSGTYPFILFTFAIALLYHFSFVSNYIVPFGSDVPGEYFLFRTVATNARWNSTLSESLWYGRQNSMLSITILPTIYEVVMRIDPSWVFKMLYPLIFSLVPLGLYQIWQAYIGKKYAFVSAFLFMAFEPFYTEMLCLNRQMIAEVFFVLLLLIIFKREMKPVNKALCFIIFSFALVTSHYALALIFWFFISAALILFFILEHQSKNVTVPMVVFFFVIMFTWYAYTSGSAAFNSILEYGDYVYQRLSDFFNPASRGEEVLRGLGLAESPSIWNTISRMFSYLTQALIAFGFISLIIKRSRFNVKIEYFIFSAIAMAFLVLLVLIPGLAGTLKMSRFYHILLFFLAPFCVLGADFIVKFFSKKERKFAVLALVLVVLIPYFLFQTELVFEVVGSDSWSIPLSGYRMNALLLYGHYGYINAYGAYGAQWLSKNTDVEAVMLYADEVSQRNILTINMISRAHPFSNVTMMSNNSMVYLNTLNVVYGAIPFGKLLLNTSELAFVFENLSLVYTNGGCEVYWNKP